MKLAQFDLTLRNVNRTPTNSSLDNCSLLINMMKQFETTMRSVQSDTTFILKRVINIEKTIIDVKEDNKLLKLELDELKKYNAIKEKYTAENNIKDSEQTNIITNKCDITYEESCSSCKSEQNSSGTVFDLKQFAANVTNKHNFEPEVEENSLFDCIRKDNCSEENTELKFGVVTDTSLKNVSDKIPAPLIYDEDSGFNEIKASFDTTDSAKDAESLITIHKKLQEIENLTKNLKVDNENLKSGLRQYLTHNF